MKLKTKNGQNLLEYSVFIFCLVVALISMQVYIKRAMQGQLRRSADDVGEQFDATKTSSQITTSVTGTSATDTWLQRVNCTGDQGTCSPASDCIPGPPDNAYYLDLDCSGIIDDKDYITASNTTIPEETPETTVRAGREDIGKFGGLYE